MSKQDWALTMLLTSRTCHNICCRRPRECRGPVSAPCDSHRHQWLSSLLRSGDKNSTGDKVDWHGRWSHQFDCCSSGPGHVSRGCHTEEHSRWSPGKNNF